MYQITLWETYYQKSKIYRLFSPEFVTINNWALMINSSNSYPLKTHSAIKISLSVLTGTQYLIYPNPHPNSRGVSKAI